jgi:hypothetical protein
MIGDDVQPQGCHAKICQQLLQYRVSCCNVRMQHYSDLYKHQAQLTYNVLVKCIELPSKLL